MGTRYYRVYPISQLNMIEWDLFTHDAESCRKSIDGSQFIVKFKGAPTGDYLTYDDTLELMQTSEWTNNEAD